MKAVVLEKRGREAAVLVNDGTVRIVRGVYNVGDIIDYRIMPRFVQWIAATAAMVILLGGSAALWIDRNYVTYAEVSLDVNPSIVYSLNKRDRVLEVRAVNDDAARIVAEVKQEGVCFSSLSEAVEKTMTVLDDQGYLDQSTDDYVLINVSADDEDRQTRLSEEVETAMTAALKQNHTMEYRIDRSDRETAKEADEVGMSVGRYAAWQRDEGTSDKKDFADKPVCELMDHNPDEDQQDPRADKSVAPGDDPQASPFDEARDQALSSPMREEEATDAPSDIQTPAEKPAADTPSDQAPAERSPTGSSRSGAPSEDIDAASDTRRSQDSDKATSEQRESREAPSGGRNESVPKQNASSDGDNKPSQSDRGSAQADRPNKDARPSSSRGSGKSSHERDPGPKR